MIRGYMERVVWVLMNFAGTSYFPTAICYTILWGPQPERRTSYDIITEWHILDGGWSRENEEEDKREPHPCVVMFMSFIMKFLLFTSFPPLCWCCGQWKFYEILQQRTNTDSYKKRPFKNVSSYESEIIGLFISIPHILQNSIIRPFQFVIRASDEGGRELLYRSASLWKDICHWSVCMSVGRAFHFAPFLFHLPFYSPSVDNNLNNCNYFVGGRHIRRFILESASFFTPPPFTIGQGPTRPLFRGNLN